MANEIKDAAIQAALAEGLARAAGTPLMAEIEHYLASLQAQPQIATLGLYTQDAEMTQAVILAASMAGVNVILLPSEAENIIAACETLLDAWVSDRALNFQRPLLPRTAAKAACLPLQEVTITLMTSGSTGNNKTLNFPLSVFFGEVLGFQPYFAHAEACEVRSTVSLQHRFGLTCHAMQPFLLGWPVFKKVCAIADELLAAPSDKPVFWITSPIFLTHLLSHPNISAWRGKVAGILSAGGKLEEGVFQKVRDALDVDVTDIYGSSETGILAGRKQAGEFTWLPVVTPVEHDGITTITTPWILQSVPLGDRIVATSARQFRILGRLDSIVKLADKRVDLGIMRQVFMASEYVDDVHLAVHPNHAHLFAWIALSARGIHTLRESGRQQLQNDLQALVAQEFPKIAIPRYFRFEKRLPRNGMAKLSQAQVHEALLAPITCPDWQAQTTETGYQASGEVPLDLVYLRGHFTSVGIVPGVVQVKWVCELAENWLGQALSAQHIENLKFQHLLRPGDAFSATLSKNAQGNKLYFTFQNATHKFSSGRILL